MGMRIYPGDFCVSFSYNDNILVTLYTNHTTEKLSEEEEFVDKNKLIIKSDSHVSLSIVRN